MLMNFWPRKIIHDVCLLIGQSLVEPIAGVLILMSNVVFVNEPSEIGILSLQASFLRSNMIFRIEVRIILPKLWANNVRTDRITEVADPFALLGMCQIRSVGA